MRDTGAHVKKIVSCKWHLTLPLWHVSAVNFFVQMQISHAIFVPGFTTGLHFTTSRLTLWKRAKPVYIECDEILKSRIRSFVKTRARRTLRVVAHSILRRQRRMFTAVRRFEYTRRSSAESRPLFFFCVWNKYRSIFIAERVWIHQNTRADAPRCDAREILTRTWNRAITTAKSKCILEISRDCLGGKNANIGGS